MASFAVVSAALPIRACATKFTHRETHPFKSSLSSKLHASIGSTTPSFPGRPLQHLLHPQLCRGRGRSILTPTTRASLMIKESSTGVEFPLVQKFWLGDESRTMGATVRAKKIAFVGVKVYAIALYVEAAKAARELGVRDRGGFFESDDDYCSALVDGGFIKTLQIQLVRDVEGSQFVEALNEALRPRMSLSGESSLLEQFSAFFQDKKLTKGTNVVLMYRTDATLDVVVTSERQSDWSATVADLSIASASLCRALFEVYLGSAAVIPEAKKVWAEGARQLLDSDKVRRDTRKGGSG